MGKGKPNPPPIPVLNPLYKGATPEDVGGALMRCKPDASTGRKDDEEPHIGSSQSDI